MTMKVYYGSISVDTMRAPETALKVLVFIGLLICFTFLYLTDILEKYRNEATTITSKKVQVQNSTWPSITFCMRKPHKPSILKAIVGSATRNIFFTDIFKVPENIKLSELYYNSTYKITRDFQIYQILLPNLEKIELQVGDNKLTNTSTVFVEEFPTEMFGLCYNLNYKVESKDLQLFGIVPKKELLETEDTPKGVSFFLTTENSRHNIIHRYWPHFKPNCICRDFEYKKLIMVYFEETEIKFYKGNTKCHLGCTPQQCEEWHRFLNTTNSCKNKCIPVPFSRLFNDTADPICETVEDNACMYKHFTDIKEMYFGNCAPPETDIQYDVFVRDDEFLDMPNPQAAVFMQISPFSMMKTVQEEIRVYDDPSLVASLGGFLGLFVGFSFHGTICYLIDRLFALII